MQNGAGTLNARLKRHEQLSINKALLSGGFKGGSERQHFGMSRCVFKLFYTIACSCKDFIASDDNGPDRDFIAVSCQLRLAEG